VEERFWGGRAECHQAPVDSRCFGSSWHLTGLSWERSCCCSAASTVALGRGGVILLAGVSIPQTQQSWHQGGPAVLRPALVTGGKPHRCLQICARQSSPGFGLPQSSPEATDAFFGVLQG